MASPLLSRKRLFPQTTRGKGLPASRALFVAWVSWLPAISLPWLLSCRLKLLQDCQPLIQPLLEGLLNTFRLITFNFDPPDKIIPHALFVTKLRL